MWGWVSMTVTCTPRCVSEAAISSPMNPAPMITARASADRMFQDRHRIVQGPHIVNPRQVGARNGKTNGTTSGGDQSFGKVEASAIGQSGRFIVPMQMLNGRPEQQVDSLVAIGRVRFVEDLLPGFLATEEIPW